VTHSRREDSALDEIGNIHAIHGRADRDEPKLFFEIIWEDMGAKIGAHVFDSERNIGPHTFDVEHILAPIL